MNKFKFLHKIGLLCIMALALFACNDKDLPAFDESNGEPNWEGDPMVLDVTVTLDMMGGSKTRAGDTYTPSDLEYFQNYVNPEKFRVLFFDENDKFIFESKSRWVKIKEQDREFISWKVSVPFFSYGNDYEYDWDWEEIRNILTEKDSKFKIALLVNRPDNEWYPGFENTKWANNPQWFDNSGPHWKRQNSIAYKNACDKAGYNLIEGVAPDVKDVFDIHHSQYDPIYDGKDFASETVNGSVISTAGYYSVVMGNHVGKAENSYINSEPYMSSTSSWVDWKSSYTAVAHQGTATSTWDRRLTILPSTEHPIPMYGIQEYFSVDPEAWLKGTTFVLDRPDDNPISLLRSVARLDLLIPDDYVIEYCGLFYGNFYARCEPMNIWTPTDQIWNNDHYKTDAAGNIIGTTCDEERLMKYGPITDPANYEKSQAGQLASKQSYWEKLAWMYGAWLEKKDVWDWGPKSAQWAQGIVDDVGIDPPQIMNPCIQRNQLVVVDESQNFNDVPGYHHYIVYTGERHTNAPSQLQNIGNTGSGNPTVLYWTLGMYPKNNYAARARYSIVVADYDNVYGKGYGSACFRETTNEGSYPKTHGDQYPSEPGNNMGIIDSGYGSGFMPAYQAGTGPGPLPIIRNHVYTLKLVPVSTRSGNGEAADFRVESKVTKSESINFRSKR